MIVRMQHLDLVCVASGREPALEKLRGLGAVHLDLNLAAGAAVAAVRAEIGEAEKAVRIISRAREGRPAAAAAGRLTAAEALALDAECARLQGERDRLDREIKIYEPYGDFDPELAKKLLDRGVDLADVLPEKLPAERLSRMLARRSEAEERAEAIRAQLAAADERPILESHPGLRERLEFEQARELMETQGRVACISGWLPEDRVGEFRTLASASGWGVLLRDPAEGETPPTLIRPPKIFAPVKALFDGLGIAPGYTEADVSVPFMCYFSLFFAMLVGDGAYGAMLLAATLFGWKKFGGAARGKSPKAVTVRSWLTLMTVFSLATVVWGALSNTWFGEQIPWCRGWPTVRWLSGDGAGAGREYDNMMFLCFTIGVTHLALARLWNGLCRLNDRSCLSEFGWAGIVVFMYVLTNSIVGIFGGVPEWCFWMFGVSFLTVFVQAKGMDKGMLFLNAMSVLGDIISYVRLFAVGLASVKVAQNFNGMALDLGLPLWIKWLPLALIMLVGHSLNLAMAGLSVLVHAVRLNTLEFSNHKGISWAGFAFKPFTKIKE